MLKNIIFCDSKIRIAIACFGKISHKHFESIDSHAVQLDLPSVSDIDTNVLSANNKKYHLPTYLNLKEISLVTNPVFGMMNKKQQMPFLNYGCWQPIMLWKRKS